jgi:hypothetical protein
MARAKKHGQSATHPKYVSRGPHPFSTDRSRRKRGPDILREAGDKRRTDLIQRVVRPESRSRAVGMALAIGMACLLIAVVAFVPVSNSTPRCVAIGSAFLVSCDADARPSASAGNAQAARPLDVLSEPFRK